MSEELSKYERMLAKDRAAAERKRPTHIESDMQVACVMWFYLQYPKYRHNLFSVPNGGRRDARTGAILKAEGVQAGVSDLILLRANSRYHALCIEMKKPKGTQSKLQKEWQLAIEQDGYKYVICRSLDDFMQEVNDYLNS